MLRFNIANSSCKLLLLAACAALLVACGGGGGGSSSSDDSEEVQNGDNLSDESVREFSDTLARFAENVIYTELDTDIFYGVNDSITPLPNTTEVIPGECGGSSTDTIMITSTNNSFPYEYNLDVTYNDSCFLFEGYEFIENGFKSFSMEQSDANNGSYILEYDVTYLSNAPGKESSTFMFLENCTLVNGTIACSLDLSEQVASGTTYTLGEFSAAGDEIIGYDVTASVSDDQGRIYGIALSDLMECTNGSGSFISGRGVVRVSNGDTIDIEFLNCDEYMVTYRGVSRTYDYY